VTRQYTPIAVPNPQELTFKVLIKVTTAYILYMMFAYVLYA